MEAQGLLGKGSIPFQSQSFISVFEHYWLTDWRVQNMWQGKLREPIFKSFDNLRDNIRSRVQNRYTINDILFAPPPTRPIWNKKLSSSPGNYLSPKSFL